MPSRNFKGQLSPEKREARQLAERANVAETFQRISELADKYGYLSVRTFEELGLTQEQVGQLMWLKPTNDDRPNRRFYTATRADGQQVKLLISPSGSGKAISAEFFSPRFYQGHGGNHDFNYSEIEGNMKLALDLENNK